MKRRGRPTLKATAKGRKKVAEMLVEGIAIIDIAKVMGVSKPTLSRLYARELISGKKKKTPVAKFKITAVQREKVIRHVACKTPIADICRLIGCTEDELRAHFPDELATGRVRYRDKVLEALEKQMGAQITSATNRLEAITAIPDPSKAAGSDASGAAAHVVGKKVAAAANAQAAAAAGGKFAPPPPPKLVVNNDNNG